MTSPHAIAKWLDSIHGVTAITPMTITIKGTSYPAASYMQQIILVPGMPAYQAGQRETWRSTIYVVGSLPACKRNGNVAFTIQGDSAEWYVAGYYPSYLYRKPQPIEAPNQHHPFGNMFLLSPWDLSEPIDRHERFPYKRVPITVRKES